MEGCYYEYTYLCRLWFRSGKIDQSILFQACQDLIKYFNVLKMTPLSAGLHRLPFLPNVINYLENNQGKLRFSLKCCVPKSSLSTFDPAPSISLQLNPIECEFKAMINKWELLTSPKMTGNVSLIH